MGRAHRPDRSRHRRGGRVAVLLSRGRSCTASWRCSSSRPLRRPRAPSSSTRRCRSSSASSRSTCSSSATRSSPRGACVAVCCAICSTEGARQRSSSRSSPTTAWTSTGPGGWPSATSARARHKGRRAVDLEDALVEAVDTYCGDRLIAFLSRPRATSLAVLLPDGYASVGDGSARDLLLGIKTFAAGEPYRLELAVGVSGAHREPRRRPEGAPGGGRRPGRRAARHRRPRPRPVRRAQRAVPPAAGPERRRARRHRAAQHRPAARVRRADGTRTCSTRCARCWTTTSPCSRPPRRCSSIATLCRSGCGASRRCSAWTSPTSTT